MRYLSVLLLSVLLPLSVQAQDTSCGSAPVLDLAVGDVIVVNPGEAQNVRQQATVDAEKLVAVLPGDYLTVWGGPTCADGYRWWQVEYDRQVGWTAEAPADSSQYWLKKVEMQTFEQGNVRFEVSPKIATAIRFEDHEDSGGDGFDVPAHRSFTLEGYPVVSDWEPYAWYWLGIAPSGGIMLSPRTETIDRWLDLRGLETTLTSNQPDIDSLARFIAPLGHYDKPHSAYLRLKSGTAQRLLAYRDPTGFDPYNYQPIEARLIYYVTGLTADGQYYIRALFPIEVTVDLPPFPEIPHLEFSHPPSEADQQVFTDYVEAVKATFDHLPPTAFTPRLALLDAMLRSIEVTGQIELKYPDS